MFWNLYLKTNPAIFIVCWDPAKKVWFAELLDPIRLGTKIPARNNVIVTLLSR
jgi:hypothetical protein